MRKQPACKVIESLIAWVELADGNEYAIPRRVGYGARGQAIVDAFTQMQTDQMGGGEAFARACLSVFYADEADALVDCQAVNADAVVAMIAAITADDPKKKSSDESLKE